MGLRTMSMSNQLVSALFAAGKHGAYEVIEDAIPADARLVGVRLSFDTQNVEFCLASSEWPEDVEGAAPEPITPMMQTSK